MFNRINLSLLLVAMLFSASLFSYQIGARIIKIEDGEIHFDTSNLKFREFERNHEIMTAVSLYCLMTSNNDSVNWTNRPTSCVQSVDKEFINDTLKPYLQKHLDDADPKFLKYLELIVTVRWPDDPLRQIHSGNIPSQSTFGTLILKCKKLLEETPPSAGNTIFEKQGLFCNSHFGSLQFLHAMASDIKIPAYETYSLMNQWTHFAYEVAVINDFHKNDYCSYWQKHKNSTDQLVKVGSNEVKNVFIADAFFQDSLLSKKPCNEQEHFMMNFNPIISFFGGKPYAKKASWSLGTIFNWKCNFRNTWCDTYIDGRTSQDGTEALNSSVQITALGSLLHMFQDSFSRAHTIRLSKSVDPKSREPKIITNPIVGFLTYAGQDSDLHEESDKLPIATTTDSNVLDPITAGAWLIYQHSQDWESQNIDRSEIEKLFVGTMGSLKDSQLVEATTGVQYASSNH